MSEKEKKSRNRRQFLKNTSLAALSLVALPRVSKAVSKISGLPDGGDCFPTTLDYYGEGPFYTDNPPELVNGQLASENEPGTRLIITGRIHNLECTEFIPNTIVDIWHADDNGAYDNIGYNLRGKTLSNDQGFYTFETIYPGKYLNGNAFRPSHIHFKITPPNFPTITTQLYFQGDPDNSTDAASSITSGQYDATHRIISLSENDNGELEGTWDIVIDGDGISGLNDLHLEKGMIYKLSPNPFTSRVEISYGVFNSSKVSLLVFDSVGQLVSTLEERTLAPEKYTAIWEPDSSLPAGQYYVVLKVNDMQVHYLKAMRVRDSYGY